MQTTIAALATAPGTGGVAIIRISGAQSWELVSTLIKEPIDTLRPNQAHYTWLIDPADGREVDEVLVLPFKGPRSFTGEDCAEIHCHGGHYLSQRVVALCVEAGARPAGPGEFTRRAVLNGRLDMTQAESILDLIHAQGEALVKLAAHNLHHRALGSALEGYLTQISTIQADMVASIDFPDEVDEPARAPLAKILRELAKTMDFQVLQSRQHQAIRTGLDVALAGAPNAGKSSLFNALLAMDRAIVTNIAGTTRDILREPLNINGIPVTLLDTAGLRQTDEPVEQLGVARTRDAMVGCAAILYVIDGTLPAAVQQNLLETTAQELAALGPKPVVVVYNKNDDKAFHMAPLPVGIDWPQLALSAQTRDGLSALLEWLMALTQQVTGNSEMAYLLSQRQMEALSQVAHSATQAAEALETPAVPIDLATVPLTDALQTLQALLGHDTTEGVLDAVFSKFCVGK